MTDIGAVRTAIVSEIEDSVTSLLNRVISHAGRFDMEEIKRLALKSPCVLVSCLGVSNIRANSAGETEALCKWAAYCLVDDKKGVSRDVGVLALVSAVLPVIPDNCWGLDDDLCVPQNIRADNLYSSSLDKIGVALWAVTWDQEITLGGLDDSTLDLFETMHTDWDQAEPDETLEAEDDLTLPQED